MNLKRSLIISALCLGALVTGSMFNDAHEFSVKGMNLSVNEKDVA